MRHRYVVKYVQAKLELSWKKYLSITDLYCASRLVLPHDLALQQHFSNTSAKLQQHFSNTSVTLHIQLHNSWLNAVPYGAEGYID